MYRHLENADGKGTTRTPEARVTPADTGNQFLKISEPSMFGWFPASAGMGKIPMTVALFRMRVQPCDEKRAAPN